LLDLAALCSGRFSLLTISTQSVTLAAAKIFLVGGKWGINGFGEA
jgi:hypothetical protein